MKSVLISIRPEWCNKIASGKKTIEVRKSKPRCETPFKCYIYCTKAKRIGFDEFYADPIEADLPFGECGNEKVIGEFICNAIDAARANNGIQTYYNIPNETCLTDEQLIKYAAGKTLYLWHISDLKIYDKPKELKKFKKIHVDCWYADLGLAKRDCLECRNEACMLSRPPQSWCYVEECEQK